MTSTLPHQNRTRTEAHWPTPAPRSTTARHKCGVAARLAKPDVTVWNGDPHFPPPQQGAEGLGDTSIGRGKVENRPPSSTESRGLTTLNRFAFSPSCAGPPNQTSGSGQLDQIWRRRSLGATTVQRRCLYTILGRPTDPEEAQVLASLSFSGGGLGFADARRTRKLGRHPRDGQETTPSHWRDYDRTIGAGDHSNFRSRA